MANYRTILVFSKNWPPVESDLRSKNPPLAFRLRDSWNPTFETGFTLAQAGVRGFGQRVSRSCSLFVEG